MSVAIVIEKRAAGAPPRALVQQSGFLRHVRKRPVAVVPVKNVLSPIGDEQVVEPVVIVIADRDEDAQPERVRPALAVTSVKVPSRLFLYRRFVASGAPSI